MLNIVIPTRNRKKKLDRCLASIPDWVTVWIGNDDGKKPNGSVKTRNDLLQSFITGDVLCAVDDVVFIDGGLEKIYEQFLDRFPDHDGILGLRQSVDHHPSGMSIIGEKTMERFIDRQAFNPEYFHFAAQEIMDLAIKIDKWEYPEDVIFEHYHPGRYKNLSDQTHIDARAKHTQDKALRRYRRDNDLTWGFGDEQSKCFDNDISS